MSYRRNTLGLLTLSLVLMMSLSSCASQHVEVRAESEQVRGSSPLASAAGFYVNRDGFYGSLQRVEYLEVRLEAGQLVAKKLLGDQNVPRGKVSFQTQLLEAPDDASAVYGTPLAARVQIRGDIRDPEGFFWLDEACTLTLVNQQSFVLNASFRDTTFNGTFVRVTEAEAREAAARLVDHP